MEELDIMMDARDEAPVCPAHSERKSHHSEKVKKNLVSRLNRIEGQVRGVKGLIEKDTYCDDVITQIAANPICLKRRVEDPARGPLEKLCLGTDSRRGSRCAG